MFGTINSETSILRKGGSFPFKFIQLIVIITTKEIKALEKNCQVRYFVQFVERARCLRGNFKFMGRVKKEPPSKLAAKLAAVRLFLNLTQEEMIKLVIPGVKNPRLKRWAISDFELGRRAPSLQEVFFYAKAVRDLTEYTNFNSDDLIDDTRDLPWF